MARLKGSVMRTGVATRCSSGRLSRTSYVVCGPARTNPAQGSRKAQSTVFPGVDPCLMTGATPWPIRSFDHPCSAAADGGIEALARQHIVAFEGSYVDRDQGFDAVAEPAGDLAEGDAGPEPRGGASVAECVRPERGLPGLSACQL